MSPLIIVTGTGTSIGKTHVACGLLRASAPSFGYKPIESGLSALASPDQTRLNEASMFHVKHLVTVQFKQELSPHLAARDEHVLLDWSSIVVGIQEARGLGVPMLVELPGGLFTPLTATLRNVDAIPSLNPTFTLLVAPDRLGVLHDVGAACVAAEHLGTRIDGVALVSPRLPDATTGRNAEELVSLIKPPVFGTYPYADVDELAAHVVTRRILSSWLS